MAPNSAKVMALVGERGGEGRRSSLSSHPSAFLPARRLSGLDVLAGALGRALATDSETTRVTETLPLASRTMVASVPPPSTTNAATTSSCLVAPTEGRSPTASSPPASVSDVSSAAAAVPVSPEENPSSRARNLSIASSSIASSHDNNNNISSSSFPAKLFEMLEQADEMGYSHIVSWQDDGKCFRVHDVPEFVATIMQQFFKQSKYKSFQRQLNLYGFTRISGPTSPFRGGYCHPKFSRQSRSLALTIVRSSQPKKAKTQGDEDSWESSSRSPSPKAPSFSDKVVVGTATLQPRPEAATTSPRRPAISALVDASPPPMASTSSNPHPATAALASAFSAALKKQQSTLVVPSEQEQKQVPMSPPSRKRKLSLVDLAHSATMVAAVHGPSLSPAADKSPSSSASKSSVKTAVTEAVQAHAFSVEDFTMLSESKFPWKLHDMLESSAAKGLEGTVSWQAVHGVPSCQWAFKVHKPDKFVEDVLPNFFKQTKYKSFQRQLNLYGFVRISGGPFKGCYAHELFQKGQRNLVKRMVRQPKASTDHAQSALLAAMNSADPSQLVGGGPHQTMAAAQAPVPSSPPALKKVKVELPSRPTVAKPATAGIRGLLALDAPQVAAATVGPLMETCARELDTMDMGLARKMDPRLLKELLSLRHQCRLGEDVDAKPKNDTKSSSLYLSRIVAESCFAREGLEQDVFYELVRAEYLPVLDPMAALKLLVAESKCSLLLSSSTSWTLVEKHRIRADFHRRCLDPLVSEWPHVRQAMDQDASLKFCIHHLPSQILAELLLKTTAL